MVRERLKMGASVGAWLMALMILFGAATALASTPEEVVKERTEAVAEALAEADSPERTVRLGEEIDQTLDFEYLAARAFGEHWEARTEEEREEFLDLLRRLLQANYSDRLGGHQLGEDYRIEYGEARVRGARAFVRAEVSHKDRKEAVVYRLHRDGDEWKIYDLVIDDISLEETYREGYLPIIEEDGWGELIDLMKERLEEMETN